MELHGLSYAGASSEGAEGKETIKQKSFVPIKKDVDSGKEQD